MRTRRKEDHAVTRGKRAADPHRPGDSDERGDASLLDPGVAGGEKLPGNDTIMLFAGWAVLLSVIAHGVTASPLVKRIAGRSLAETEEGARATR